MLVGVTGAIAEKELVRMMSKYESGQRWTYRNREQDKGSTLVIGLVQKRPMGETAVHVSIDNISMPHLDEPGSVGHMPFSEQAIDASVLELVETGVAASDEFDNGVRAWEMQEGGVFEMNVAQAIDGALQAMGSPQVAAPEASDPFDAIVSEMKSGESPDSMVKLYHQLFSLEKWFFLCNPQNPRAPMEIEFTSGDNLKPTFLVFTSLERAVSAAVEMGIYPQAEEVQVMPAPVVEAVTWLSGPDCHIEWVCFNMPHHDFGLDCDVAAKILKAGKIS